MNKKIDIKKYEGHTRGPWRYYGHEEFDGWWIFEGEDIEAQARVEFAVFEVVRGLDDPDLNLMIDAPDLFAEVKRLLDFIQSVWDGLGEAGRNEHYELFREYMGEEE